MSNQNNGGRNYNDNLQNDAQTYPSSHMYSNTLKRNEFDNQRLPVNSM